MAKEKIKVAFINPDTPNSVFWNGVTLFMEEVAHDLDIDLSIYYGLANRYTATEQAYKAIENDKPDYILFIYQLDQGHRILSFAEKNGINTFIFNTDIPANERRLVGLPGEKFKYWRGHFYPDDYQAGMLLANELAEIAKQSGHKTELSLVGFSGGRDSTPSFERERGLIQAAKDKNLKVQQIFQAYWQPENVLERIPQTLARYPDLNLVWSASDAMAIGAVNGLKKAGKIPGKTVFVGGIDWTSQALDGIQSGDLSVSVGGHFMDGGWSLIQIYDLHHRKQEEQTTKVRKSQFQAITQNNLQHYQQVLDPVTWKTINFKQFTKTHNPDMPDYRFKLEIPQTDR